MNLSLPPITARDRARGYVEIAVELCGGSPRTVRVHALNTGTFFNASDLSEGDALQHILVECLRESPDFVREQLSPVGRFQAVQALAALTCAPGEAAVHVEQIARSILQKTPMPELTTMNSIETPTVTVADVLAQQKQMTVRTRAGEDRQIVVKAANWRTHMTASFHLSEGRTTEAILAVLAAQPKPVCLDSFLDEIAPAHLAGIATVAMQLSNGVDAAKEREPAAEKSTGEAAS